MSLHTAASQLVGWNLLLVEVRHAVRGQGPALAGGSLRRSPAPARFRLARVQRRGEEPRGEHQHGQAAQAGGQKGDTLWGHKPEPSKDARRAYRETRGRLAGPGAIDLRGEGNEPRPAGGRLVVVIRRLVAVVVAV